MDKATRTDLKFASLVMNVGVMCSCLDYFRDPEHVKAFEKWEAEREAAAVGGNVIPIKK